MDSLRFLTKVGLVLLTIVTLISPPASACGDAATTPMEKAYCQITAKGHGQNLPRFDDFRRNPPQTQALLLRRPAKEAGVELPVVAEKKMTQKETGVKERSPSGQNAADNTPRRSIVAGLRGCQVAIAAIRCAGDSFKLLDNRSNGTLSPQAFDVNNELLLANNQGLGTHSYLQLIYPEYLTKMDEIGLAGATLSYSKFYYIYEEAKTQQQDFSGRMKTMYHFLKKDKQTMVAARRHQGKPSPPLQSCDLFGDNYIACDWKGANWVYKL